VTTPIAPVEVSGPDLVPYRYGLMSAAPVTEDPDYARWRLSGVVYGSICADSASVWLDRCVYPPTPVEVQGYEVTFTKAAGVDVLVATLTARHAGYGNSPVWVTVDGLTESLATVGAQQSWDVTPSTTVPVSTANDGAVGPYPACSTASQDIAIPATGDALAPPVEVQCLVTPSVEPAQLKTLAHDMQQVQGMPFGVIDGIVCYLHTGRTIEELRQIARERFLVHEQFEVERQFFQRELGGLGAGAVTVLAPPVGTAWPLSQGVGALEAAIAETSGAVGMIHAPRKVGAPAKHHNQTQLSDDGRKLLTPLDNVWSFGAGYTNTGPTGSTAPAGQAWLYATGPVQIRRSALLEGAELSRSTNENVVLVERDYVITADCPLAAALVQLPES
jgi:hypothetical protein